MRPSPRETIRKFADLYARRLRASIVPYFARITADEYGGYLLLPDVKRSWLRQRAHEIRRHSRPDRRDLKHLVAHARLVWTFAHAHRNGIGDYLGAAQRGYRFLLDHFHDDEHGGYVWTTERAGQPFESEKTLYGQAFVIYALVEYACATGSVEPIERASTLYELVNDRLRDRKHGGWHEHARRDWSRLDPGEVPVGVGIIGRKSADTCLHWMEALAALCGAVDDESPRRSLTESFDVLTLHLFPDDPARAVAYCAGDWSPDTTLVAPVRFGLQAEWAWLAVEAERVLGREPSWPRCFDTIDDILERGFDHRRGGVYRTTLAEAGARHTDKIWWAQAEMLSALTDALAGRSDARYEAALVQLLRFVERRQLDPSDGVWLHTVTARGGRRIPVKSDPWKVGYHEVRALTKFVDAFAPEVR